MIIRLLLVVLALLPSFAPAQELECEITIATELLTAEARENLTDFVFQLENYINSYRWTEEDLGGEKIPLTINISFQGSPKQNTYAAQAFIGSQRRIYNSEKNTALLRVMDDQWEFAYQPNKQMLHDENTFDPLLSFLDFYAYIVIGLDFESYQEGAGIPYLEKSMNIVNTARSGGKGWEMSTSSEYSRGGYIEELLNPAFSVVREAIYRYHYRGLDLLYYDEAKAKRNMIAALDKIGTLTVKMIRPSQVVKIFFDTKYLEIAESFKENSDPDVFRRLMSIDPAHRQTYEDAGNGVQ